MKKALPFLLATMMTTGILTGCSSNASKDSSTSASSAVSTVAAENIVIGTKEETAKKIVVTNDTGLNIDYIGMQNLALSSMPENMLASGTIWKAGEKADLYIKEQDLTEPMMVMVAQDYGKENQVDRTLLASSLNDLGDEAKLLLKEDQLDLVWTKDGQEHSLLDAASQAPAQTPAEQTQPEADPNQTVQTAPEQQVQEPTYIEPVYQAPAEDPGYQEPVVNDPVVDPGYTEPVTPVEPAPSLPNQGSDTCVDPGLIAPNPDYYE